MSDEVTINFGLNGRDASHQVQPRLTLAEMLRNEFGLTGTKVSCEMQVCGACTVLVDQLPISACTFLATSVDRRSVTTIEGVAPTGGLHPLQQAFIDEFAAQCGFCTPGFVMMGLALLAEEPEPSRDQVVQYFEGNICRCTGYRPIIDAVLSISSSQKTT